MTKNRKNYLIGIVYKAQPKCGKMFMLSSKGLPKKSVLPTRYVAVPGKLMNWLLKEGLKWKGGLKPPKKWVCQRYTSV